MDEVRGPVLVVAADCVVAEVVGVLLLVDEVCCDWEVVLEVDLVF